MKSPDGFTKSSWYQGINVPQFPPVEKSMEANVCVVGAGIAGLTSAYNLLREGRSVIVVDEGPIGGGQTGRTSAHLASAIDDRFIEIERQHGEEAAKLAHESHARAIDCIEAITKRENISCDFVRLDGYLSNSANQPRDLLNDELIAARKAGAEVELLEDGGIGGRCLRFRNQARFHPLKYPVGLADAVTSLGGKIYTGNRVMEVQGGDSKAGMRATARLGKDIHVHAEHVVVAANSPSPLTDWIEIYTKQAQYRTYLIGASIPRESITDALYWDTGDPYHYVRIQTIDGEEKDLLLIGGEDHKVGQPPEASPFLALEDWGRKFFPSIGAVKYQWSGQVQEPVDGLGFIGRAPTKGEGVFVITGDSGMGLTHGTLGALLVSDLIAGRPNPWEKLYDPSRKILNRDFVKENANTVLQYKDLLTPGDVSSESDIPKGEGAVLREGITKRAVYQDAEGNLHRHSAICTHLKCVVHWNSTEKSWDCPCHGSRFDPYGKVLMGPAVDDLAEVTD